jgi:hypothetical protein
MGDAEREIRATQESRKAGEGGKQMEDSVTRRKERKYGKSNAEKEEQYNRRQEWRASKKTQIYNNKANGQEKETCACTRTRSKSFGKD